MTTRNPFNETRDNWGSPQRTLLQDAARRASATKGGEIEPEQYHDNAFASPIPTRQYEEGHPAATPRDTPDEIANSARKEWRLHGAGVTQALEEKRRQIVEDRPGAFSVRVLSADTRLDVSGAKYTAYILSVQLPSGSSLQMEHRFSDFSKLNDLLKSHHIVLDTPFPPKHWAGRIGSWTPSSTWAPEQYKDLIEFRKVQLDIWLVHVVELYNLGDFPHSVAGAVYDFLTVADRPPCEQDNTFDEDAMKWNNPLSFTLGSSIRQATVTIQHMCHNENDQSIPLDLLQSAKGLAFLTVVKAGLVVSGRIGTGLLLARLDDRWSAPCAIGTVGMGYGMLAGCDINHYLVVLTTHQAVEALLHGTVQLGTEVGIAVGPVGRVAKSEVSASNDNKWTVHPAYAYAHSKGFFVGISLEGSVLTTRDDVNSKFYSRHLSPDQILDLPCPKAAHPLYRALERAMATEIPEGSFRPSQLFTRSCKPSRHGSRSNSGSPPVTQSPIHGLPTVIPSTQNRW